MLVLKCFNRWFQLTWLTCPLVLYHNLQMHNICHFVWLILEWQPISLIESDKGRAKFSPWHRLTSQYSHSTAGSSVKHQGPSDLSLGFLKCMLNILITISSLLHTISWFYVIYRYVISKWRSIRPVEINQHDITMATDYDITMDNDIASYVKSQWVMMLLGTSIVKSQWVMTLLCVHIMESQCIITFLWTFSVMYFLLYA